MKVLNGYVIGSRLPRDRDEEFLGTIDRQVPKESAVHMILDNYAPHEHEGRGGRRAFDRGSVNPRVIRALQCHAVRGARSARRNVQVHDFADQDLAVAPNARTGRTTSPDRPAVAAVVEDLVVGVAVGAGVVATSAGQTVHAALAQKRAALAQKCVVAVGSRDSLTCCSCTGTRRPPIWTSV